MLSEREREGGGEGQEKKEGKTRSPTRDLVFKLANAEQQGESIETSLQSARVIN